MKRFVVLIVLGFIASESSGQSVFDSGWAENFSRQLNRNIQNTVQQIQQNVASQVDELTKNTPQIMDAAGGQGVSVMSQSSKQVYIASNGDGSGKSYAINVWLEGNILYHRTSVPSPDGTTKQWIYTLDLDDLNSQPILQNPNRKK